MLLDMFGLRFESWGLLHGKRDKHPFYPESQGSKSLSAILLIALLALAISLPLLQLGFFAGDTTNIEVASEHSFAKMLFTGSGIRQISRIHFTPMMGITLRMDWLFFGTNCFWYSLHNVLWLWLLGVSAYVFMRTCGAGVLGAALAGAMLVLAPISVSVSAWYSTRHYIGGLCWTIFSLSFILKWNKEDKKWLLWGSRSLLRSCTIMQRGLFSSCIAIAAYYSRCYASKIKSPCWLWSGGVTLPCTSAKRS